MSNDQFTLTGESINATKEKNIAVVKKIYADVSAKNLEGVFNSLTEDISWEPPYTAEIPHTKLRSGKNGVKDWVIEMTNEVTYSQVTPKDIFADDNAITRLCLKCRKLQPCHFLYFEMNSKRSCYTTFLVFYFLSCFLLVLEIKKSDKIFNSFFKIISKI